MGERGREGVDGLRLGLSTKHKSRWYSDRTKDTQRYRDYVKEDLAIRKFLSDRLHRAGIAHVEIKRTRNRVRVDIHAAHPGIIIGQRGAQANRILGELETLTGKQVQLSIVEVKNPELEAQLVAQGIAERLQANVPFQRAMREGVESAVTSGALGIRVQVSGKLDAEAHRTEFLREGRVPLHTLRAQIDYGFYQATTALGQVGVKVWIYKGELTARELAARRLAAPVGGDEFGPDDSQVPAVARGGRTTPSATLPKVGHLGDKLDEADPAQDGLLPVGIIDGFESSQDLAQSLKRLGFTAKAIDRKSEWIMAFATVVKRAQGSVRILVTRSDDASTVDLYLSWVNGALSPEDAEAIDSWLADLHERVQALS